jgi:hypothetical protein
LPSTSRNLEAGRFYQRANRDSGAGLMTA